MKTLAKLAKPFLLSIFFYVSVYLPLCVLVFPNRSLAQGRRPATPPPGQWQQPGRQANPYQPGYPSKPRVSKKRGAVGVVVASSSDSMAAVIPVNGTKLNTKMKGTSSPAGVFLELRTFDRFYILGGIGSYAYDVKGGEDCEYPNCSFKANYTTIDALGKFVFTKGKFAPYVIGGVSILTGTLVETTGQVIKGDSAKTQQNFRFGIGANIQIGNSFLIPFDVMYSMFPPTSEVTASSVFIRFGMGYLF